jgi:fructoselysine 6-kinase
MRLACVGDNVVDIYPSLGLMFPGGNTVNVAVAARRAGIETAYIGVTGTDRAGKVVMDALRAEQIDVSRARVVNGPNAYTTIELHAGDRVFGASDPGVSNFSLNDEDRHYLAGFDIVHSGDNSMLEDQIGWLAEVAAVSFDFGERPPAYWRPLAPYVRIACFSGAQLLSVEEAEELAHSAARLGPKLVLVSEGARGAMVLHQDRVVRISSSVTPVDTLGAGDSLIGRFLVGIIAGEKPRDALVAAGEVAAETCLSYGAFGHATPLSASGADANSWSSANTDDSRASPMGAASCGHTSNATSSARPASQATAGQS